MTVLDCITSFVDGRVRLRHPALKDQATLELVSGVIGGVEGVTAVQTNPVTGSMLIFYDPDKLSREDLLAMAEQGAQFFPELQGDAPESQPHAPAGLSPCDELLQLLGGRQVTKFVNRGMLVALAASLAGLPLGNKLLHTAAGGAFVGGMLQHLLAHRKSL